MSFVSIASADAIMAGCTLLFLQRFNLPRSWSQYSMTRKTLDRSRPTATLVKATTFSWRMALRAAISRQLVNGSPAMHKGTVPSRVSEQHRARAASTALPPFQRTLRLMPQLDLFHRDNLLAASVSSSI